MSLPPTLQMEIDLSAAAHKREIAEGFAKLRAELIPPLTQETLMNSVMRSQFDNYYGPLNSPAQGVLPSDMTGWF